jgi:hypothetical protein
VAAKAHTIEMPQNITEIGFGRNTQYAMQNPMESTMSATNGTMSFREALGTAVSFLDIGDLVLC